MSLRMSIPTHWLAISLILLGLSACSSDEEPFLTISGGTSSGKFVIESVPQVSLQEGAPASVTIPIKLDRKSGHIKTVMLGFESDIDGDDINIAANIVPEQLNNTESISEVNLLLPIDALPITSQQKTFYITANDGTDTARFPVQIDITPVDAPDVYLLLGQSNMVGFSGDGTKLAGIGGPDEPNPRIMQLNVTKNDQYEVFTNEAAFTSLTSNIIESNRIVQAEDPLHVPVDPSNNSSKNLSYIGLGLSFAKAALPNTEKNIVLVPAAWSGSSFCANQDAPIGQWNAQETDDPNFGNTWLFDRAVERANLALAETGGILRGLLWHQGESDANFRCADQYLSNLEQLAQELRVQINQDRRGPQLRQVDANIPFVLSTMSRGIDERADLSEFWPAKQKIDDAHRTLPSKIAHAALTISDDLTPDNGYPCGNSDCIHYGAEALREMGRRYYDALRRATAN